MLEKDIIKSIRNISCECEFVTYYLPTCPKCPEVKEALDYMAKINPKIKHTKIDASKNKIKARRNNVSVVPTVFLQDRVLFEGQKSLMEILELLGALDNKKDIKKINKKPIFDVLVIGGGPAGVAACIYAARKGLKTGVVVDKFGGQLLETLGIENFIATKHIKGKELAKSMQEHLGDYDVDVMMPYYAKSISKEGKNFLVMLDNSASLKAKSIIVATGAKWRRLGVKGENKYLNKGVHFCQHCDGPLFAGKNVVVAGGGNSGAEAVIDLAKICKKVVLVEYADQLKADSILQEKLKSIKNVVVKTSLEITEIIGNDKNVSAIKYRENSKEKSLKTDGVFVQIGLSPNTEWLSKLLKLNKQKEIVVDEKTKTSVDGIFAAGDVNSTPYKQIIIAMGEGAKAALSAFDYLARG